MKEISEDNVVELAETADAGRVQGFEKWLNKMNKVSNI